MRNILTGNIKYRFKDNKTAGQRACGFIMSWLIQKYRHRKDAMTVL